MLCTCMSSAPAKCLTVSVFSKWYLKEEQRDCEMLATQAKLRWDPVGMLG